MTQALAQVQNGPAGAADPAARRDTDASTAGYSVRVVDDFAMAESAWRALEADSVMSVYQCYDWLRPWYEHVGRHEGARPAIVVVERNGSPAFLLPLGVWKNGPLRIARWLGGKLNNYNFGLWRRDDYASIEPGVLAQCLADVAREARVDAFELLNIPENWDGLRSPFLGLPHTPSPSASYVLQLDADFDTLNERHRSAKSRRTLRKKLDRLSEAGEISFGRGTDAASARRIVEATIEQRDQRAAATGVPSVFAQEGVAELLRQTAALEAGDAEPVVDTHFLAVDGVIRATYVGGVKNGRYSCSLNSFREDELTAHSPGDQLLHEVIRDCCERGMKTLDLGIGEMRYKTAWCEEDPLIDCFMPVSLAGRLQVGVRALVQTLKRTIKHNRLLWNAVLTFRRIRARAKSAPKD